MPNLAKLRTALSFGAMARESGMSLRKLELAFIQDTWPERIIPGFRSPEAFKRYARGMRVAGGEGEIGSPVAWGLPLYEEFRHEYQSPFFELISLDENWDGIVQFSHHIFMRRMTWRGVPYNLPYAEGVVRIAFKSEACWNKPDEVSALPSCSRLDALCLLLIAFRCNVGKAYEGHCARLCLEWLDRWLSKQEVDLVRLLMIEVLSERVPAFASHLSAHLAQRPSTQTPFCRPSRL